MRTVSIRTGSYIRLQPYWLVLVALLEADFFKKGCFMLLQACLVNARSGSPKELLRFLSFWVLAAETNISWESWVWLWLSFPSYMAFCWGCCSSEVFFNNSILSAPSSFMIF